MNLLNLFICFLFKYYAHIFWQDMKYLNLLIQHFISIVYRARIIAFLRANYVRNIFLAYNSNTNPKVLGKIRFSLYFAQDS